MNIDRKTICALLALTLLLALCGPTLAGGPPAGPGEGPKADGQEQEKQVSDKLAKLVDAGTISKDQAGRVMGFWREREKERLADFEKMKNMSAGERRAYMDEKTRNRTDPAAELAKSAGLSESQAQAAADALRPPGPPPPR